MQPDPAPHALSADHPITTLADDTLGRRDFAIQFANAIRNWRGDDSLVLALYAGWGDGKTSFKNMVLDHLRQTASSPVIAEFNPWEWSGQQQIAAAFFEEVGKQIGKATPNEPIKHAGLRVRTLGKVLNTTGKLLAPVAGGLAFVIPPVAPVLVAAADAMKTAGTFASDAAEATLAKAELEDQSLAHAKRELKEALLAAKTNILVVMDDVDRLEPDQVKLLFQLIKANTDFPRLIFLLLFQRDTIEACLQTGHEPGTGTQYLEKIIQVGLDLPQIPRRTLHNILHGRLQDHLRALGVTAAFDQNRWNDLYRPLLAHHFVNLRAVKRFLNTFSFHLGSFVREVPVPQPPGSPVNRRVLEVNPVDFAAIEALRVFEPTVHAQIAARRDSLVEFKRPHRGEGVNTLIDSVLELEPGRAPTSQKERRNTLSRFFQQLFPSGGAYNEQEDLQATRHLRICQPAFFDRYFELAIPETSLPRPEVEQLLALVNDPPGFLAQIQDWHRRSLIPLAWRDLLPVLLGSPIQTDFLTTLFAVSDPFCTSLDAADSLAYLAVLLLPSPDKSGPPPWLATTLLESKGILLPVMVLPKLLSQCDPTDKIAPRPYETIARDLANKIAWHHYEGVLPPDLLNTMPLLECCLKWGDFPAARFLPLDFLQQNAVPWVKRLLDHLNAQPPLPPPGPRPPVDSIPPEEQLLLIQRYTPECRGIVAALGAEKILTVLSSATQSAPSRLPPESADLQTEQLHLVYTICQALAHPGGSIPNPVAPSQSIFLDTIYPPPQP